MNINDLIGRLQSQREQHGYDCKVVIEHEERDYDFIVCGSTGRITLSVDTEIEIEIEEDEACCRGCDKPFDKCDCGTEEEAGGDEPTCAVCDHTRDFCMCDEFEQKNNPMNIASADEPVTLIEVDEGPPGPPRICGKCGTAFSTCDCDAKCDECGYTEEDCICEDEEDEEDEEDTIETT